MANGQREVLLSPSTADSMHIGTADTARLDLDLDVKVLERLGDDLGDGLVEGGQLALLAVQLRFYSDCPQRKR